MGLFDEGAGMGAAVDELSEARGSAGLAAASGWVVDDGAAGTSLLKSGSSASASSAAGISG